VRMAHVLVQRCWTNLSGPHSRATVHTHGQHPAQLTHIATISDGALPTHTHDPGLPQRPCLHSGLQTCKPVVLMAPPAAQPTLTDKGNRAHLDAARWPTGTEVETEQQTNRTGGGSPTGCNDGQCHANTEPQCLRFAFKVKVRSTPSTALGHAWVTHKSRCGPDRGSSTQVNVT
jgi:hypothetical protein